MYMYIYIYIHVQRTYLRWGFVNPFCEFANSIRNSQKMRNCEFANCKRFFYLPEFKAFFFKAIRKNANS